MAKTYVVFDESAFAQFVTDNPKIKAMLMDVGKNVAANAQASAQDAQEGPGGRLSGYAEAGFSVEFESRGGSRPRVNIRSKADIETALAAHFHTQRRDGVGHLRAALYDETQRG